MSKKNSIKKQVRNEAVFQGRIVSMRGDGNNGSITIATTDIIRSRRNGKFENTVRENYPTLSYNRMTQTKGIADHFKVGDNVTVYAHMQSYLRLDERSGETMESMNAYIDEIYPTVSLFESAFKTPGRVYPGTRNEVYLVGEVIGLVKRSDRVLSVRLDMSKDGKRNTLNLMYFNAPANTVSEFGIGDTVCVLAELQTIDTSKEKEEAAKRTVARPYQSLVIFEMMAAAAVEPEVGDIPAMPEEMSDCVVPVAEPEPVVDLLDDDADDGGDGDGLATEAAFHEVPDFYAPEQPDADTGMEDALA